MRTPELWPLILKSAEQNADQTDICEGFSRDDRRNRTGNWAYFAYGTAEMIIDALTTERGVHDFGHLTDRRINRTQRAKLLRLANAQWPSREYHYHDPALCGAWRNALASNDPASSVLSHYVYGQSTLAQQPEDGPFYGTRTFTTMRVPAFLAPNNRHCWQLRGGWGAPVLVLDYIDGQNELLD